MHFLAVLLFFCLLWTTEVVGVKILVYSPRFGRSHLMFVGKIADTLAEAGHDVTLYQPVISQEFANMTGSKKVAKIIERPQNVGTAPMLGPGMIAWDVQSDGMLKSVKMLGMLGKMFKTSCEYQLQDNKTLELLMSHNYDIAIAEFFDSCAFGLFRRIGVMKTIILYASAMPLNDATYFGLPASPSFVPDFVIQSPVSGFTGRFMNLISYFVGRTVMMPNFVGQTAEAFKIFDANLDYRTLFADASFYFVNTDELVDFPRPITHKCVNIGGVGMKKTLANAGNLDAKYKKILDNAKEGVVFMSFGTVASSHLMPNHTKKAFLDAFAEFPNVQFMWKYEKKEDQIARDHSNVMTELFFPQPQILGHPNLKAFITHGGANSLSEAAWSGVPMIVIPLFGDQMRNAINIEERGLGLKLPKDQLKKETIVAAIRQLIHDDRFKARAQKTARMIRAKPMSPDERLIKYTEFAALHDVGEALDMPGRHLNFVQYYSLDVLAVCLAVFVLISYVLFAVVRFAVQRVRGMISKPKVD